MISQAAEAIATIVRALEVLRRATEPTDRHVPTLRLLVMCAGAASVG